MIRPSLIIPRIRAECPIFSNRVAGTAKLRLVFDQNDLPVPHAFFTPRGSDATGDDTTSPLDQEIIRRFTVTVAVANISDDRGQGAAEALCDVEAELVAALVGWSPEDGVYDPIRFLGTPDEIDVSRARAWADFDFETRTFSLLTP